MNEENVKYAIEVMKDANNLKMNSFQSCPSGSTFLCYTIDRLHACGNTACFIGYLCLTDKWKEYFRNKYGQDTTFNTSGDIYHPRSGNIFDDAALADYLGIEQDLAHAFVFGYSDIRDDFYSPIDFELVKPEHVIEKLEQVLKGELT